MRDPKSIPSSAVAGAASPAPVAGTAPVSSPSGPNPVPISPSAAPYTPPTAATSAPPPVSSSAAAVTAKILAVTVADRTPIRIALAADVAADANEGSALKFVTAEEFRAAGNVVIPKGAAVSGVIAEGAGKKKFLRGSAKMTFSLTQVEAADGNKLNVRATPARDDHGDSRRPVELVGKKPPKELAAQQGDEYIAYIDGQQTVSLKK